MYVNENTYISLVNRRGHVFLPQWIMGIFEQTKPLLTITNLRFRLSKYLNS